MLRHILTLAIAAALAPAALLARGPEQETYYQGKLLRDWFEQLGAESPKLRREAVQVLAQAGPAAKEAIPVLSSMASRDDDAAVRLAAADALESIIVTPEQATGRIVVAALSDPDPAVAAEAVACIARLDKNAWFAAEGFAKLREMQSDKGPKPEVRQAAQKAIEAIEKSIKAAEVVTGLASKDAKARALAKRKLEIVKQHPALKKAFLNAITDFKLDEKARETLRGDYERTYPAERQN